MIFQSSFEKRLQKVISKFDFQNITIGDPSFVFIHIPKNAGTSIYQALGIKVPRHYTVNEYQNMLGKDMYDRLFSFAIVRNPFSRFISLYNYARLEESYYHSSINPENARYGKHMDYDILKNASVSDCVRYLIEGKLQHNPPHIQWLPQTTWLKNVFGDIDIKYLGRLEDLEFHGRNLSSILGFESLKSIGQVNSSGSNFTTYKQLIDSSSRSILENYYKDDLENFGYEF